MLLLRRFGPGTDHGEIGNCTIEEVAATPKDHDDYFAIILNVCFSLTVAYIWKMERN
jgi:hypothetical protein